MARKQQETVSEFTTNALKAILWIASTEELGQVADAVKKQAEFLGQKETLDAKLSDVGASVKVFDDADQKWYDAHIKSYAFPSVQVVFADGGKFWYHASNVDLESYKPSATKQVEALKDDFLKKVAVGNSAHVMFEGKAWPAEITAIEYPTVWALFDGDKKAVAVSPLDVDLTTVKQSQLQMIVAEKDKYLKRVMVGNKVHAYPTGGDKSLPATIQAIEFPSATLLFDGDKRGVKMTFDYIDWEKPIELSEEQKLEAKKDDILKKVKPGVVVHCVDESGKYEATVAEVSFPRFSFKTEAGGKKKFWGSLAIIDLSKPIKAPKADETAQK